MDEIKRLKRRIAGLEKTLQIVTGHSGRIERNLRQLFEVVSDVIPVPMVISLETGKILFSNGKAREIFGYSEEDFHNTDASDLYENAGDLHQFMKIHDAEDEIKGFAVTLKKADGSPFPASLFSHQIVFEGQDCLLTVLYDLSELRKEEEKRLSLERHLRQTQKMEAIGTMAGGIAHDFNNVLTIIFGKLQLAMMTLPEESKSRKHLNDALAAAKSANAMVMQILDFCRQKEQERKPLHISAIVREAMKMVKSLISPNIMTNLRIKSESPIIRGDPTQIYQLLMNLCTNANHVLQDNGGVIEIMLEEVDLSKGNREHIIIPNLKPGYYVRLTVSDNGPGMDKEIIDRVFDPFFTTKAPGEGTGMGLTVVHGIVQRHEGVVSIESELGKGSAFHCYFPVIAKTGSVADTGVIQKKTRDSREKFFFADHGQDVSEVCGEMPEIPGHDTVSCSDSKKNADTELVRKGKPESSR